MCITLEIWKSRLFLPALVDLVNGRRCKASTENEFVDDDDCVDDDKWYCR